jgi:hypothetical protein
LDTSTIGCELDLIGDLVTVVITFEATEGEEQHDELLVSLRSSVSKPLMFES